MPDPTDSVYQPILDRLRQGDDTAVRELTDLAYARLRRLVAKIMNQSFPGVRREVDSVLNETWMRLYQALVKAKPPTPADFFRFAAHKVRQVLLDVAERDRRIGRREVMLAPPDSSDISWNFDPADSSNESYDPAALEQWAEFHRRVELLPDEPREVFKLHWYLGLTQADIATALGKEPKQVSRLWLRATSELAAHLPE